ncbi:MAG: winged helix-turn-helix domain-containing protein [Burkholderiales bacterium]
MTIAPPVASVYRFAGFDLLPRERSLRREGRPVAVGPRAFDVLVALVERRGALVTKNDLFARAWPNLVVEENNLAVQVSALRKILGHGAIATVSGHGYRFGMPVDVAVVEEASPTARPATLPRVPTTFVGRDAERGECVACLAHTRLLTLVGPGGIGKTRLAIETAALATAQFADGVTFVDLAPLDDPRSVMGTIATALGISDPALPLADAIQRRLQGRAHLVILDNCEHVLAACAAIAAQLLRSVAGPRILATSREPLRIAEETIFQVPPLPVPASDASEATLRGVASAALFAERAVTVDREFAITPENAADLAEICRRLDGIPLAIELAASRVRAMPVSVIAAHLDEQFKLLVGGDRSALPRQHTLRATLEWSCRLLDEAERSLFRRLSVFAGGFEFDAAEVVGAAGDVGKSDVLYLLAELVDKSLIAFEPRANRYRMLEPVRQYALERLVEAGEEADARDAHLRFHVDWARSAGTEIRTHRQAQLMARIAVERDNFAIAFAHARDKPDGGPDGLAMTFPILTALSMEGNLDLCRRQGREALAHAGGQEDSVARSRALYATAWNEFWAGRYEEAHAMSNESALVARRCGDDRVLAEALYRLGNASLSLGRLAEARQCFLEQLDRATAVGDRRVAADAFIALGELDSLEGHLESAQGHYLEALELNPDEMDTVVTVLFNLSRNEASLRNEDSALRYMRGALQAIGSRGSTSNTHSALMLCAWTAARRGDWRRSLRLFGAAAAHRERIGFKNPEPDASIYERALRRAREAAGHSADEAFAAGRALHEDAAFEEAVAWLATLPESPAPT